MSAAAAEPVEVYIDYREYALRDAVAQLPHAAVNLHVGDVLIVQPPLVPGAAAPPPEQSAFDGDATAGEPLFVVERKQLSDLAASITAKDEQAAQERWSDQKRRCISYCAHSRRCIPVLVVEG